MGLSALGSQARGVMQMCCVPGCSATFLAGRAALAHMASHADDFRPLRRDELPDRGASFVVREEYDAVDEALWRLKELEIAAGFVFRRQRGTGADEEVLAHGGVMMFGCRARATLLQTARQVIARSEVPAPQAAGAALLSGDVTRNKTERQGHSGAPPASSTQCDCPAGAMITVRTVSVGAASSSPSSPSSSSSSSSASAAPAPAGVGAHACEVVLEVANVHTHVEDCVRRDPQLMALARAVVAELRDAGMPRLISEFASRREQAGGERVSSARVRRLIRDAQKEVAPAAVPIPQNLELLRLVDADPPGMLYYIKALKFAGEAYEFPNRAGGTFSASEQSYFIVMATPGSLAHALECDVVSTDAVHRFNWGDERQNIFAVNGVCRTTETQRVIAAALLSAFSCEKDIFCETRHFSPPRYTRQCR
jgi:hypothetical protein